MNILISLFLIIQASFIFVAHVDYSRKDIPMYKHSCSGRPFLLSQNNKCDYLIT